MSHGEYPGTGAGHNGYADPHQSQDASGPDYRGRSERKGGGGYAAGTERYVAKNDTEPECRIGAGSLVISGFNAV